VLAAEDRVGFAGLTPPQRHVRYVLEYHYESDNGGISQFFWNEQAELIRATPAALDAVGAPREAAVVRAGIRLFGRAGMDEDIERRRSYMDEMPGWPAPWDDLPYPPGRYENLVALAWLHAAKHPRHFTDPRLG
jgi:hypothetical protein